MDCGQPYPAQGVPFCCPNCNGLFDYDRSFIIITEKVEPGQPGIWKYRHTFGFSDSLEPLTIGEGNTPLLAVNVFDHEVYFKCEYANPSGSFKDRGMATMVAFLRSRCVLNAVEDSSGNAGASFAAYAARAGIEAVIYIPATASGPKRRQIESYGAKLIPVNGNRSESANKALAAAGSGVVYASHTYLPFNLPGYATCAYEIVAQLGCKPGTVILPVGQGGLLLGLARGFKAMLDAGVMDGLPMLVGVQAARCAPLVAAAEGAKKDNNHSSETIAEGVRVAHPLRKKAVLESVLSTGGRFVPVADAEIHRGRDALARLGFYVEPTSALIWAALRQCLGRSPDPIVAVLTGSGYKVQA